MRVQSLSPKQTPTDERPECLVELGGWYDHLAPEELRIVAQGRVRFIGRRLARVDWPAEDLLRLGGSRAVHSALGFSDSATRIPDPLSEALCGTFAVRFHDARGLLNESERRRSISLIWQSHPRPAVDLSNPEQEIHVFAEPEGLWFAERIGECSPELRLARPRRHFFRSYETPPRKARVLVNLAGAGPGMRFVDPFCGTGALVLEAEGVGCRALGSDLDPTAVAGAARNALDCGASASFFIADARRPPVAARAVDCAATDLPYGMSASLRDSAGHRLYRQSLDGLAGTIRAGSRMVVMSLGGDQPCDETDGWILDWECREIARTVVRAICVWRKA